jgi:phosphate-selective porin OprO/OprP
VAGDEVNRICAIVVLGAMIAVCLASAAAGQTSTPPSQQQEGLDNSPLEAGDEELDTPKKDLVKWNHYDGDFFHIRLGGGYLYEGSAYSQNAASEEQFSLVPETKVRDARILIKGGFNTERPITFSTGILYDTPTHSFLVRETGVMFTVPELWGSIFVGRTKEGFSLNKVMAGYAGWTMERTEISDATIPILWTASSGLATCRRNTSCGTSASLATGSRKDRRSPRTSVRWSAASRGCLKKTKTPYCTSVRA